METRTPILVVTGLALALGVVGLLRGFGSAEVSELPTAHVQRVAQDSGSSDSESGVLVSGSPGVGSRESPSIDESPELGSESIEEGGEPRQLASRGIQKGMYREAVAEDLEAALADLEAVVGGGMDDGGASLSQVSQMTVALILTAQNRFEVREKRKEGESIQEYASRQPKRPRDEVAHSFHSAAGSQAFRWKEDEFPFAYRAAITRFRPDDLGEYPDLQALQADVLFHAVVETAEIV